MSNILYKYILVLILVINEQSSSLNVILYQYYSPLHLIHKLEIIQRRTTLILSKIERTYNVCIYAG